MHFNESKAKYIAQEAEGDEREKYWQLSVSYYKGYYVYKTRAAYRPPIMVLESI